MRPNAHVLAVLFVMLIFAMQMDMSLLEEEKHHPAPSEEPPSASDNSAEVEENINNAADILIKAEEKAEALLEKAREIESSKTLPTTTTPITTTPTTPITPTQTTTTPTTSYQDPTKPQSLTEEEKLSLTSLSCDGVRPSELQAMVIWHGEDLPRAMEVINSLKPEVEVIHELSFSPLSDKQVEEWCKIVYSGDLGTHQSCRPNKQNSPVIVVVKDVSPIYFMSATGNPKSPPQYMNKHLKTLKDGVRNTLKRQPIHMGCHSSANVEEAVLAIDPLRGLLPELDGLESTRPIVAPTEGFNSIFEMAKFANTYANGCVKVALHNLPMIPNSSVKRDLFVNDYYEFKTFTNAKATDQLLMRENGEKGSVAATIKIGGVDEEFNIRFLGDNYIAKEWHMHALATADPDTGEMTPLNAGMISLYLILTYHKVSSIPSHIASSIYNLLGNHYSSGELVQDDVANLSPNVKQKLKSFMQLNKYPLPPEPVSAFSDQKLNDRAAWWN